MTSLVLWHALLAAGLVSSPSTTREDLSCTEAAISARSVWAPPTPREMTRVVLVTRPFLGTIRNTWGAISDARAEHYFARPFMLGLEMAPIAVAVNDTYGTGAITHLRLHAAYVTDFLTIGFALGERLRHFGTSGVSLGPTLRLGTLDGLRLELSFGYVVARNPYSGKPTLGFSNTTGTLSVPLSQRLAAALDAGFSLDVWIFLTLGLRQRLTGDGGPGSWFVSGAFGLAWVSDRTVCRFEGGVGCSGGTALSFGPTVAAGLERRF